MIIFLNKCIQSAGFYLRALLLGLFIMKYWYFVLFSYQNKYFLDVETKDQTQPIVKNMEKQFSNS